MNLSPAPRDRATIHAMRILVVEDDPDMSRFIVRGLGVHRDLSGLRLRVLVF